MAGVPPAGQSRENPAAGASAFQLWELSQLAPRPTPRDPQQDKGLAKVEVFHLSQRAGTRIP